MPLGRWLNRPHSCVIVRVMATIATIQEATRNATSFALQALGPERTQGMRLEEIESATENGEPVWHITLSMLSHEPDESGAKVISAPSIFGGLRKREYKTFSVLKDTGEVTSMKIRELSNA
jgi:hypothetical protein